MPQQQNARFDRVRVCKIACFDGNARAIAARGGLLVAVGLGLASCSSGKDFAEGTVASPRVVEYGEPVPKGGGVYKVGKPYQVAGRWYYPKEDPNYQAKGTASWYGLAFHGRRTANGEVYDMDTLSAAHPTMPLPSYAKVTNLDNGYSVVVRVNDRGPYAHGRVIDVSKRAAEMLDFKRKGTTNVQVAYLGAAPISGADGWALNVPGVPKGGPGQPTMLADAGLSSPARINQIPLPASRPQQSVQVASLGPVALPASNFQAAPAQTPAPQAAAYHPPANPYLQQATYTPSLVQPGLYVQAGSFRDAGNAQRLGSYLQSSGQPVEVAPVDVSGTTYYRVRVGPLSDGQQAQQTLQLAWNAGANGAHLLTVE